MCDRDVVGDGADDPTESAETLPDGRSEWLEAFVEHYRRRFDRKADDDSPDADDG